MLSLAEKIHHAAAGTAEGWVPWAELSKPRRDEWVLVAETAFAEIHKIPIRMRLTCEKCGALHVDESLFETKPHHTHACQDCGAVWRPAIVPTVGVRFLPGFKNESHP